MEQNLDLDLKTYELVRSYDKLISKKETELQNCFFDNIRPEDKTGNIELPLVSKGNGEDSDYARLKREKQMIQSEISLLEKKINYAGEYLIKEVEDTVNLANLSDEEKKVVVNRGLEFEVEKAMKEKEKLELRLKTIEEDPKSFLRYDELDRADFSIIKDENVKNKLYEILNEINEYKAKRELVKDTLKDAENVMGK